MKHHMVKWSTAAAYFMLMFCASAHAEMTGRQIMEKQNLLHKVSNEYLEEKMLLIDRSGRKEVRSIRIYNKKNQGNAEKTLIVFDSPDNIRGLAMLTWKNETRQDDQWLYLSSLKKLQRIAEGNKKSYFAGTDFTYEDFETENLDNCHYTLQHIEDVNKHACYVIDAFPADEIAKKKTGYGKRRIWIRKDIFFAVQVWFFNHRGQHVKTMNCYDLVNVKDSVYRADKIIMDNHHLKHKTICGVNRRDILTEIRDMTFQHRYILSERHVK
jgi:hypothetical protein